MLSCITKLFVTPASARVIRRNGDKRDTDLYVLRSDCTDPYSNLATEEWLLESAKSSNAYTLFLWRNKPTVVIGAHQNAARECNLRAMEAAGVLLTRRRTGGGAVYHDLQNTNFTFITPPSKHSTEENNSIVIDALHRAFGLDALASGRNDICVRLAKSLVTGKDDGLRKVSGCAFRKRPNATLHHGTMLLDTDLNALAKYLTPSPAKLQAKGVSSVRSRVANISQLLGRKVTHEDLCAGFEEAFVSHHTSRARLGDAGSVVHVHMGMIDVPTLVKKDKTFRKMRDDLDTYDWKYGSDPDWSLRFEERRPWGMADVRLDVVKGKIVRAVLFTDCLNTTLPRVVSDSLRGCKFTKKDVVNAVEKAASANLHSVIRKHQIDNPAAIIEAKEAQLYLQDFAQWIAQKASI